MRRFNLNGPQEIMALMVRRKWWIIYPFFAMSALVLLLTYMLPKMYVSEALVLIQPRDVPNDFVKDLIAGSTAQRLSAIQQTVLSRTNLLEILREFQDSLPEYRKLNIEEQIVNLHNQIDLTFNSGGAVAGEILPVTSFRIAYKNRNPEVAQKITEKVTSVFIKQDNLARELKISGSVVFLTDSLNKVAVLLDASETKKKNLKLTHRNELPEQLTTNLAMLATLNARRRDNLEAMDRAEDQLAKVNRDLSMTPKDLVKPRAVVIEKPVVRNPLLDEYVKAQNELNTLINGRGFTKSHPDVIRATAALESVKKQLTAEELASLDRKNDKPPASPPADEIVPNPIYQTLLKDKEKWESEIRIKKKDLEDTDKDIAKYNTWIQNAPQSEQQIADVLRENADLTKQYQDLKNNLAQAQLAEDLEARQQGSQFKIQDPANLPLSPTKPAKPAIAAAGIMLSLLLGIALAVIVDIANQKMWTLSDVETLIGTTVLVEIPEIVTAADLNAGRRRRWLHAASFVVLSAVYGVCLFVVYKHPGFVLSQLDPVIRRLY